MPSVLYNVQGEEGDDASHPNCFRASFSKSPPTLADFIAQFPLASLGTFHFRFKAKTEDFGFVWKDVKSADSPVPLYNGLIWAKVMQVSGEPSSVAPARSPASASKVATRAKSPPAGRGAGTPQSTKNATRVSFSHVFRLFRSGCLVCMAWRSAETNNHLLRNN